MDVELAQARVGLRRVRPLEVADGMCVASKMPETVTSVPGGTLPHNEAAIRLSHAPSGFLPEAITYLHCRAREPGHSCITSMA